METPPIPETATEPEQDLRQLQPTSERIGDTSRVLASKEPVAASAQDRASQLKQDDLAPKQHVQRYDTFESLPSTFGRRTNTGWSTAMSTATDYTEPDLATLHDEDEDGDEAEESPVLRRFKQSLPSDDFQSYPPTRASTFAHGEQDARIPDDLPTPRHPDILRVQGLSSGQARGRETTEQPDQGVSSSHHSASPLAHDVSAAERSEETASHETQHIKKEPGLEKLESKPQVGSDDDSSDADNGGTHTPDEDIVESVCDRVLKDTFDLGLRELAVINRAEAAYEATQHYLEELSRLVPVANLAGWTPTQSQMTRGGGGYGQASGQSQGNNGGQRGRRNGNGSKRPPNDDDDDSNHDGFEDGNGPGGNGKRPRMDGQASQVEDQNLSCPYRKRNPVKFNVRDFQSCAVQSFPDISQLKRHVKLVHRQKPVSGHPCPRCKRDIGSKEEIQQHLSVPQDRICAVVTTPQDHDPEDGIDTKTEDALNGRRANSKVDTWDLLWKTLFPDDSPEDYQTADFIPPIELEEVHVEFHTEANRGSLRDRISEAQLWGTTNRRAADDCVAKIMEICEQHIELVFATCRQVKTGNLPGHKRRKRTQRPKNTHTPTTEQPLTYRPGGNAGQVLFPAEGSARSSPSSSQDTGSVSPWAFSAPSMAGGLSHISPIDGSMHLPQTPNYGGLLATESSAASVILNTAGGSSPGLLSTAAFSAHNSPHHMSDDSPVASFSQAPVFPTVGVYQNAQAQAAGAFRPQRGGYQMMGFGDPPMVTTGDSRMPLHITTSMPMQQGMVDGELTAIDQSTYSFGYPSQHMGHGHGGYTG